MIELSGLRQLGLTEGEARVYLALLQTGSSTVGPIVKRSGLAYSNIYEVLQRLQEKGLVSFVLKAKTRHYRAVPPQRLEGYIEKKRIELESQRSVLKELMPKLELFAYLQDEQPEAEVFVGWRAMVSAQHKLIAGAKKGDELIFFYVYDEDVTPRVDEFFMKFEDNYKKMGLKLRGISTVQYKNSAYMQSASHLEMRYVDFPVPNTVDVCNDKVLLTAWRVPLAILITSEEIADNYVTFFEEVWKQSSVLKAGKD